MVLSPLTVGIRILFQNSDNYYTVIKVDVMDSNEDFDHEVTIVGYFPQIVEGETYLFKGKGSFIILRIRLDYLSF